MQKISVIGLFVIGILCIAAGLVLADIAGQAREGSEEMRSRFFTANTALISGVVMVLASAAMGFFGFRKDS